MDATSKIQANSPEVKKNHCKNLSQFVGGMHFIEFEVV